MLHARPNYPLTTLQPPLNLSVVLSDPCPRVQLTVLSHCYGIFRKGAGSGGQDAESFSADSRRNQCARSRARLPRVFPAVFPAYSVTYEQSGPASSHLVIEGRVTEGEPQPALSQPGLRLPRGFEPPLGRRSVDIRYAQRKISPIQTEGSSRVAMATRGVRPPLPTRKGHSGARGRFARNDPAT